MTHDFNSQWIEQPSFCNEFKEQGYTINSLNNLTALQKIRSLLVQGLRGSVQGGEQFSSDEDYLNHFHQFVDLSRFNEARVKVHREVCASDEFKSLLFKSVYPYLKELIGNEIVMQRQVNFVAHLPNDPTNLLYLHTDSWAGCSAYEVILWLPLVDVFKTKSMFIVDLNTNRRHLADLKEGKIKPHSAADLMKHIEPDIKLLTMKFGEALLFSPILLHGALENKTTETRFILNVRFKALFSPYGSKALGETFTPVNFLPATQVGLNYEAEFGMVGVQSP